MKIFRQGEGPAPPPPTVPMPPRVADRANAVHAPSVAESAPDFDDHTLEVAELPRAPFHPRQLFEREILLDARMRALGLIPLFAFFMHFLYKAYVASPPRPGEVLWMCHVAALLQGLALLASSANGVRVASAWALIGIPNFVVGVVTTPELVTRLSWLTHLTLPTLAMVVMSQVRMDKKPLLFYVGTGTALFLVCQQLARWFTDPRWNINIAHEPWQYANPLYLNYPLYFAAVLLVVVSLLTVIFVGFRFAFAPESGPVVAPPEQRTYIAAQLRRGLR